VAFWMLDGEIREARAPVLLGLTTMPQVLATLRQRLVPEQFAAVLY
jgi:hypothetical protein